MSTEQKPLTADGIAEEITPSYGSRTAFRLLKKRNAEKIEAYAAQQVAAALSDKKEPEGKINAESISESLAWEHHNDRDPDSYANLQKIYLPVVERTISACNQQTAALREELDVYKTQVIDENNGWGIKEWREESFKMEALASEKLKELEAVKKERDELKFENDQIRSDLSEASKQIKGWKALCEKAEGQRDEAVKLLDIAAIYHVEVGDDWQNKYAALKRRVHAG